jgi:hypothetical protein
LLVFYGVAHGDAMQPVAGITSGTFTNPDANSTVAGDTWSYGVSGGGESGTVVVSGTSFGPTVTPLQTLLATLTFTHTGNPGGGDAEFTADLNLLVNFSSPSGGTTTHIDGLQVVMTAGTGVNDELVLNFGGLPGPQSFSAGDYTYTVTLDGYFNDIAGSNEITSLVLKADAKDLGKSGDPTAVAYLLGTITSDASSTPPTAHAPEPTSVLLLSTVVAGTLLAIRRRRTKLERS